MSSIGAATDTYTATLNTAPASAVELTVSGDDDVLVSTDGSTFSSSITISVADTSAQTIHVRAFNDADVEGTHTGTITQTVTASSDANYPVGLLINRVISTVIDDERTPLVAVDLQADGESVPANWTEINQNDGVFSATTFSDLIREDGSATTIDLTVGPTSSQGNSFGPSDPDSETVPVHTPSLVDAGGVLGWTKGSANTVLANWSGLTPSEKYNVYVLVAERFGGGTDINHTVTILGEGSDDPTPFTQTTTGFGGELQINNQQGDDAQALEDFALTVTADSSGEIDVQLFRDDGVTSNIIYIGAVAIQQAVTPTSEPPVVDVVSFNNGTGQLIVNAGATDSISISALNGATGTVVVQVNGVANTQFGTVTPSTVQTIVINGGTGDNLVDLTTVASRDFTNSGGVGITILGGAGNDTLSGSNFTDNIDGEAGDDFIQGGSGSDILAGGAGIMTRFTAAVERITLTAAWGMIRSSETLAKTHSSEMTERTSSSVAADGIQSAVEMEPTSFVATAGQTVCSEKLAMTLSLAVPVKTRSQVATMPTVLSEMADRTVSMRAPVLTW